MLGISVATLYSYVSRGLIRSEAGEKDSRERRYLAEDVEKLLKRKAQRGSPEKGAREALQWGSPVLESALTLIDEEKLYYRGHDATELALTRTFEEVATLLWTGSWETVYKLFLQTVTFAIDPEIEGVPVPPLTRMHLVLALAADDDLRAFDKAALPMTGARILLLLERTISGVGGGSSAERLAAGWKLTTEADVRLIDAALILSADHELNASSFAARVVASTDATLYQVVNAGLSAIQGFKHGGNTRLVAAFWREVEAAGNPQPVIRAWLQRGERIPGFGHVLYRQQGDPRAAALLNLLRASYGEHPALALADRIIQQTNKVIDRAPNIDFALVTLARVLALPEDAPLTLFALGRTAGWIAHAIEQYATGELIRPRAVYTGSKPGGGNI
ncbi:MAG: citrate synthase family protein [Chloroflexi bacterium]|nr:citrate synthase family protein [Chloroflexota bacterium]